MFLLAVSLPAAWGFALSGPVAEAPGPGGSGIAQGDTWQTITIGYNPISTWDTLPIGPKNIGEEYRRNCPTNYYAYNANFAGFFGSNGEAAVDSAFAIMNSLSNVDSYSSDLSMFPLNSQSINYTAQGLELTDLKSETLHLVVEQMGLINPARYVWALHGRQLEPDTTCPSGEIYNVVQRNFDIIASPLNQLQYSPYINGTLYSYGIAEYCDAAHSAFGPAAVLAVAVPIPANPPADPSDIYTPVASEGGVLFSTYPNPPPGSYLAGLFRVGGLVNGGFYTGLTRDDVAGLRYLMTTNNVNWESLVPGSVLVPSSGGGGGGGVVYGSPFVLCTSDYTAFALAALTNNPGTLATLFPGLVITGSSYYFTNIATPNIIAYYTNYIGAPAGSPPTLVVTTNGYTYSYPAIYSDTFANVVIISYHTNTSATLVTVTVGVKIGAPVGSPVVTNTTSTTITLTNVPSGDYYINTNYLCGTNIILSTLGTNVVATTNVLVTGTNAQGYSYSQSLVTYSTNHCFVAKSPICAVASTNSNSTNGAAVGYYQGIGGVQFVRVPDEQVDPLTGNFLQPITSTYTMEWYDPTNYTVYQQTFQRIVTRPDILFSAEDLAGQPLTLFAPYYRNVNFNDAYRLPGLAGPGTINPSSTITYNKVGDIFENGPGANTNVFLGEDANPISMLAWGSFDGTTNAPVVYPNGTSIQNLENELIITISPPSLPDGANGAPYGATFSATGGQSPYTWSLAGTQLPNGLSLDPSSGILSGTPSGNAPGPYDFTIQLTDSEPGIPRVVNLNYSITIDY